MRSFADLTADGGEEERMFPGERVKTWLYVTVIKYRAYVCMREYVYTHVAVRLEATPRRLSPPGDTGGLEQMDLTKRSIIPSARFKSAVEKIGNRGHVTAL